MHQGNIDEAKKEMAACPVWTQEFKDDEITNSQTDHIYFKPSLESF